VTTERPRLKDMYLAYIRGETTFEALIAESELQIAERERREQRGRGEQDGGTVPAR
jgi:hypothetical protein